MIEAVLIAVVPPRPVIVFEKSFKQEGLIEHTVTSSAKLQELAFDACAAAQREKDIISKNTLKNGLIDKKQLDNMMTELGIDLSSARAHLSTFHSKKDLRALRLAAGLSQQQLARNSGLQQPEISALEKGKKQGMHRTKLERVQRALGVDYDTFSHALNLTQENET